MRKGKSLLGLRVIDEATGTVLGQVKDLIFDHETDQALALLLSEKELFGLIDAQIIPWNQIVHIGVDVITVPSRQSRISAGADPRVKAVMNRKTALSGTHVYTTDGQNLGTLADAFFEEKTGRITGYEISGGFVSDTIAGKRFLPASRNLTFGKDVALVDPLETPPEESSSEDAAPPS